MSGRRGDFKPSPEQLRCAKLRICGYLERERGAVQMGSVSDTRTLHRHISRPRDLGRNYAEQCITLREALGELITEHKIAWDDSEQMLGVISCVPRQRRRNSSERYDERRRARGEKVA